MLSDSICVKRKQGRSKEETQGMCRREDAGWLDIKEEIFRKIQNAPVRPCKQGRVAACSHCTFIRPVQFLKGSSRSQTPPNPKGIELLAKWVSVYKQSDPVSMPDSQQQMLRNLNHSE